MRRHLLVFVLFVNVASMSESTEATVALSRLRICRLARRHRTAIMTAATPMITKVGVIHA